MLRDPWASGCWRGRCPNRASIPCQHLQHSSLRPCSRDGDGALCSSALRGGSGAAALCPAGVQPDSPSPSAPMPLGCFLLEEMVRLPRCGEQGAERPYIPIANHPITVRSLAGFYWEQCGGMQGLTVPGPAPRGPARGFFGLRLSRVHTQQSVLRLAAAPRATHWLPSVSHPAQPAAGPALRCLQNHKGWAERSLGSARGALSACPVPHLLPPPPASAHHSPLVSVSAQATAADGGELWQLGGTQVGGTLKRGDNGRCEARRPCFPLTSQLRQALWLPELLLVDRDSPAGPEHSQPRRQAVVCNERRRQRAKQGPMVVTEARWCFGYLQQQSRATWAARCRRLAPQRGSCPAVAGCCSRPRGTPAARSARGQLSNAGAAHGPDLSARRSAAAPTPSRPGWAPTDPAGMHLWGRAWVRSPVTSMDGSTAG